MTRTVERISTLIRKKIKFPHILGNSEGSGAMQSHVWLTTSSYTVKIFWAFPHIFGSPSSYIWLCTRSYLNFPICEGNFVFFFISAAEAGKPVIRTLSVFSIEACYIRDACGRRWRAWRPSPTPASCPSVTSAPAPATAPAPAPAPATATAPGIDWPEISTPAAGRMTQLRPTGENNFLLCLFVCNDQEVAWGKQIKESCDHLQWMIMYTLDVWPLLCFAWLKCSLDK